jgi:hypothetical protein
VPLGNIPAELIDNKKLNRRHNQVESTIIDTDNAINFRQYRLLPERAYNFR